MSAAPDNASRAALDGFVHGLAAGLVEVRMHDRHDATGRMLLTRTLGQLARWFDHSPAAELRVSFDGSMIHADGRPAVAGSLQAGRLLERCAARRIAAITFGRGVSADALRRLLELLNDDDEFEAFRPGVVERALEAHGIRRVRVELRDGTAAEENAADARRDSALRGYQQLAATAQDNQIAAVRGEELEIDATRGIVERAANWLDDAPSDLFELATFDDIDRFTVGHSVRVALLAMHVARAAGASDERLLVIGTAGLLHDIGKSRVPSGVLFKEGRLEPDEWREMAEHPRLGAEILLEQRNVPPAAIGAAFTHHMGPTGGGYPEPVLPFRPSSVSRLIRVCDVFEALTAVRPYKPALTPIEALAIMHRNADDFDADWLRFFVETIGLYPIGSQVWLDTGERATVVAKGPGPDRPTVRLLDPPDGLEPVVATGVPAADGVVRRVREVVRRNADPLADVDRVRIVAPQTPLPVVAAPIAGSRG